MDTSSITMRIASYGHSIEVGGITDQYVSTRKIS